MEYLKLYPQACQATSQLVAEANKATFRTMPHLKQVEAATEAKQWLMPGLDAELSDVSVYVYMQIYIYIYIIYLIYIIQTRIMHDSNIISA